MSIVGIWYGIFTNLTSLLPASMFYRRKMIPDAILTGVTGLSSFLYHGNNSTPSVFNNVFKTTPIRNSDVVLSYLLAIHTINTLVFKKSRRRWDMTIAWLPVCIYMAGVSQYMTITFLTIYAMLGLFIALYRRHRLKWVTFAYLFAAMDVLLMWMGDVIYKNHYYWIHGTHHITCFSSVACMIRVIKFKKRKITFESLSLTDSDIELKSPRLKHRRSISLSSNINFL